MAFSMAGGGPSNPQINVTPLIDVLLVLIIVFMVVVSMSKTKGLEAQIPQPASDDKSQNVPIDRTIVIQVVWGAQNQPPGAEDQPGKCEVGGTGEPTSRYFQAARGASSLRARRR
jgi:hypothetical protein